MKSAPDKGEGDDSDRLIYENGVGDSRGYYEDGAYVAAPINYQTGDEVADGYEDNEDWEEPPISPQDVYTHLLTTKFLATRKILHSHPPRFTKQHSTEDIYQTSHNSIRTNSNMTWRQRMLITYPTPTQVALMSDSTLWRLLDVCRRQLSPQQNIPSQLGCWIWALLTKLRDAETMSGSEMSNVRNIAKRAVKVKEWIRLQHARQATWDIDTEQWSDIDDSGDETGSEKQNNSLKTGKNEPLQRNDDNEVGADVSVGDANPDDEAKEDKIGQELELNEDENVSTTATYEAVLSINAAEDTIGESHAVKDTSTSNTERATVVNDRSKILSDEINESGNKADHEANYPDENTLATLDMIITIAGELYRQRDLLLHRSEWE